MPHTVPVSPKPSPADTPARSGEVRPPPDAARLFLAVWPDAAARDATVAAQARWCWPRGARPVPPDRLHLTLHFIGDVDRALLPVLTEALSLDAGPMSIEFDHFEHWTPGLAVLRTRRTPPALTALHAGLAGRLRQLGQAVSGQRLRPHVTLARRAMSVKVPDLPAPVVWTVQGYALVESVLGPGGGYRLLRRYAGG